MKAITLWPEWAWAINLRLPDGSPHPLAKRVECRGWPLPEKLLGQWIALHAGKSIGGKPTAEAVGRGLATVQDACDKAGAFETYVVFEPIVTSAITGMLRVNYLLPPGVVSELDGIRGWKNRDSWGWVFDWRPLSEPVPCKGAQGIWTVPPEVESLVLGRVQL